MNNSVFGKTQENLHNRVNVEIITDATILRKRVAKPNFYRGVTENLRVIQCKVKTLTLNRPIYMGFTVLELSKLHLYNLHYNHMNVKFPHADKLKLLFTDTDSREYAVQTDSIYVDMAEDADSKYDFIEYPADHPIYNTTNKKAPAYFTEFRTSRGICRSETEVLRYAMYR